MYYARNLPLTPDFYEDAEGATRPPLWQVPRSKSKSSDRQAPTARTSLPRRALRKWRPLIFPSIFRLLSLGMRDLHLIFLASSHLARAAREFPSLLFPRVCFFSLPTLGVRYSHFLFPARLRWVCAIQEFPRCLSPPFSVRRRWAWPIKRFPLCLIFSFFASYRWGCAIRNSRVVFDKWAKMHDLRGSFRPV